MKFIYYDDLGFNIRPLSQSSPKRWICHWYLTIDDSYSQRISIHRLSIATYPIRVAEIGRHYYYRFITQLDRNDYDAKRFLYSG